MRADKVTGSGLGLALVKELTEKLGGQIDISESANTLAITIHLPLPTENLPENSS